jgi:hypothetical protein
MELKCVVSATLRAEEEYICAGVGFLAGIGVGKGNLGVPQQPHKPVN